MAKRFFSKQIFVLLISFTYLDSWLFAAEPVQEIYCPKPPPAFPTKDERNSVYLDTPYKAGETAIYNVYYLGAFVGQGTISVKQPYKFQPFEAKKAYWHRNFQIDAKTGDWYKLFFVAHDIMESFVRPWDDSVSKFYFDQNEGKMFGSRIESKKWFEFRHNDCKIKEKVQDVGKPERTIEYELSYGAKDTVGVAFWLRSQKFEIGKKIRTVVYSSEKNWWLEAEPVAFEQIKVAAGTYKTVRIKLQTFIGKDLQQKGDVEVWIANESPSRELVQIRGEIKIGSVWIELSNYKAGPQVKAQASTPSKDVKLMTTTTVKPESAAQTTTTKPKK